MNSIGNLETVGVGEGVIHSEVVHFECADIESLRAIGYPLPLRRPANR